MKPEPKETEVVLYCYGCKEDRVFFVEVEVSKAFFEDGQVYVNVTGNAYCDFCGVRAMVPVVGEEGKEWE